MLTREHNFVVELTWTGNLGAGTSGHRDYSRDHEVTACDVPTIHGSADKTFHGDRNRWNPEQLFLASIAQCHMLTYLYLATQAGLRVVDYRDSTTGTLVMDVDGIGGEFSQVTLKPTVTVLSGEDSAQTVAVAHKLHAEVADTVLLRAQYVHRYSTRLLLCRRLNPPI